MGKPRYGGKSEGGTAPFYGVRGPENGVYGLAINGIGIQHHECIFHTIEAFKTFLDKYLVKLFKINRHDAISRCT